MLIDWFTVGAQLLNFTILVWLMKRFLYQPVLDAIAAREQKIAAALADAAAIKAESRQRQDEFHEKNRAFDEERAALLRQAGETAQAEGERMRREAREAEDAASVQRATALRNDAQQLHAEIARLTQQQVFDIARRVMGDLAGVSLEQRMCEVFIARLQTIEGPARDTLGAALQAVSEAEPALLRSAGELPAAQRAAIQAAVDTSFGHPVPLRFETTPGLVSGLELSAQGRKLAWNVSDYLGALSSGVQERLDSVEHA